MLVAAALLRAAPAFAQVEVPVAESSPAISNADLARASFAEGLAHLRAERWAEAEGAFRRSLALVPRASTRYNLALVLFKQRRARESLRLLDELLSSAPAAGEQRHHAYARTLRPLVLAELARLTLDVQPADARLEIDGEAVPALGSPRSVYLDPGPHRLRLSAPGHAPQSAALHVRGGDEHRQEIRLVASAGVAPKTPLSPAPSRATAQSRRAAEPSPFLRVAPWVTIGTGSLLIAGGVVAFVRAKRADDDFTDACPSGRQCDPELQETQRDVERYARLSAALLAGGGVLVAGGVVWQIVTPHGTRQTAGGVSDAWLLSARGRF